MPAMPFNRKLQIANIANYKFPRGTSRHVTVASAATFPSTYALPSRRAAVIRHAFTATSIRN
jgi:hypothetical protein